MDPLFNAKLKWNGGCLEWQGSTASAMGYGYLRRKGKNYYAHRYAWTLEYGEIPQDMVVRHTCDNPLCCNLEHLVLGTRKQNSQDMVRRGRSSKGAKNGMSRLTEDDVRAIRLKVAQGASQASVAREYSLGPMQVSRIVRRLRWEWLED